jgi:peptidoglycan/xylan/chitin deacetylase (PgdA/CDA1 family)
MTRPIPILVYHQIAPEPPRGTPFRSLCVAPADFARQMRFMRLLGYKGLSMSKLMPYLTGTKHGKVFGITFDDGYVNNLEHAAPVLQALGFSSTCYAVSQLLGKTNVWDSELGIPQVPLMNRTELRQWTACGQEVGAHTRNHVHLNAMDSEAAWEEIALCKTELESVCGGPVEHFCYPYGDFAAIHTGMVEKAGYQSATTTQRGRCRAGERVLQLPRVPVVRSTTLLAFWLKIATQYEDKKRA